MFKIEYYLKHSEYRIQYVKQQNDIVLQRRAGRILPINQALVQSLFLSFIKVHKHETKSVICSDCYELPHILPDYKVIFIRSLINYNIFK